MCASSADASSCAQLASLRGGPADSVPGVALPVFSQAPPPSFVEYQRLQLFDYGQAAASRLRIVQPGLLGAYAGAFGPYSSPPGAESLFGFPPFFRFDPRSRFVQEEPKPQHSYIGLIAMAILSSAEKKMVLSDIYQYILDNYPYFRNRGPGWRNSIRHNLSLNDCFVKAGRSANGKGHYWAIHPANVDDFKKGDFRRRKAQRKVRKHMGLSVPDDDDSPTPTPPPPLPTTAVDAQQATTTVWENGSSAGLAHRLSLTLKRRQFDVESLLAPDPLPLELRAQPQHPKQSGQWPTPSTSPGAAAGCPLQSVALPATWPGQSPSLLAIHQERLALFRAHHQEHMLQRWCPLPDTRSSPTLSETEADKLSGPP
ncbi:forkhead domain 102C [Haemaphysalis longicornis]